MTDQNDNVVVNEELGVAPTLAPEAPVQNPSITIEDLVNVLRIINVASERGAFKAPELSSVGVVHDRIAAFVNAAQKANVEKANGETSNDSE